MYEELLESSEFYQRRYHNFASKIIVPTFILFLFVGVFLCFMKKEISLKTSATVEPYRVIAHIQSTSNNKIKSNYLQENKLVKAGEVLVEYEALPEMTISAVEDGFMHLRSDVSQNQIIPEGTQIASLYPILEKEKKVNMVSYISSRDISKLSIGDILRFQMTDSSNKAVTIKSKISNIDSIATQTEAGNFFKIIAETEVSDKEITALRYGMEGTVTIVTGQSTYFDYYVNRFFNQ
ncbi:HlyD family efflux transporter periplasmic adaptor subunit [Streptococcus sp. sy010]|uniref:HlyD family efflux transporter periplasmic adaptor subunit n=1 Tax=Streptococcus sp. sy010 TaxID=2600148 RepID=UPI0011B60844|nr:HlyD family efflux transporter periplasmic adaptor subunit [Streptococcus sp. sy010]TWT16299.1 HlyD family efflux transporter periplasmic adaptor subunit [Streptococcus sp. sy010]